MKSIDALSREDRSQVQFVLTDIDDTLTHAGRLPAKSYDALWRLHDAGLHVVPVTGRPAGWCDLICRQWPVAGVVGENGAFVFYMEDKTLKVMSHPLAPEPESNRERLAEIAREVYASVPGTRPAKDQFSRLYDVAIDFREEPPMLGLDAAREIQSIFESHGAQAKISSIHVNAWFGSYDKLSMARHFLMTRFDLDISDPGQNRRVLYCGDSPNDEPMFEAFHNSVGVANIREYLDDLVTTPRFITTGRSAEGFAEAVRVVLDR